MLLVHCPLTQGEVSHSFISAKTVQSNNKQYYRGVKNRNTCPTKLYAPKNRVVQFSFLSLRYVLCSQYNRKGKTYRHSWNQCIPVHNCIRTSSTGQYSFRSNKETTHIHQFQLKNRKIKYFRFYYAHSSSTL